MNEQYYKENLPMYVNGNLSAEEQADFEQVLGQDDALQKDADFLSAIRQHVKAETIQTPGEMGLYKLKRELKKQEKSTTATNKLTKKWRTFAIAASLALVVQAGLMVTMTQQKDIFTPLSGSDYAENVIQVQFKNEAKESEISALLLSFDASIIEGPTKNGIYRIQLHTLNDEVIKQLQKQSNIIDFVSEE